jgi:sugar O-acyltransferase (sialic acid O-acetyltransferase NeuD family)
MSVCLVGAGDFGSLLMRHLRPDIAVAGFLDDTKSGSFEGLPILGGLGDLERLHGVGAFAEIVVAIGYRHLDFRAALYARAAAAGIPIRSFIHPAAFLAADARVGAGVVVLPGCTIDSRSVLGDGAVLQVGSTVAHDSVVGAHCFLGPGVCLAGFVSIGDRSFLGIGTVVIDHVTLGPKTQTGGGTVVTRSGPGNQLLVGAPARVVRHLDDVRGSRCP